MRGLLECLESDALLLALIPGQVNEGGLFLREVLPAHHLSMPHVDDGHGELKMQQRRHAVSQEEERPLHVRLVKVVAYAHECTARAALERDDVLGRDAVAAEQIEPRRRAEITGPE